jgi:hypothetical protein
MVLTPERIDVQLETRNFEHHFSVTSKNCNVLGIHDLFGTGLAMIFSFHVGLTDSGMQLFFLSESVRHFVPITILIFVRK